MNIKSEIRQLYKEELFKKYIIYKKLIFLFTNPDFNFIIVL